MKPAEAQSFYWSRALTDHAEKLLTVSSDTDSTTAQPAARSYTPSSGGYPIVVVFGWMYSRRRSMAAYLRLYNSCGWDALACNPPVLNLWSLSRAKELARLCLDELYKEVGKNPRPIVLAAFSGGVKACHAMLLRLLLDDGTQSNHGQYKVVRECLAGQIFDSCPIDFVSHLGVRFLSQPPGSIGPPNHLRAAAASAAAVVLDSLFLSSFESQRQEQWSILERSAVFGPVLALYSKNDPLAPYERIDQFLAEMAARGTITTAVCWEQSDHVGHLRRHPKEYSNAVRKFLAGAFHSWYKSRGGRLDLGLSQRDHMAAQDVSTTVATSPACCTPFTHSQGLKCTACMGNSEEEHVVSRSTLSNQMIQTTADSVMSSKCRVHTYSRSNL